MILNIYININRMFTFRQIIIELGVHDSTIRLHFFGLGFFLSYLTQ